MEAHLVHFNEKYGDFNTALTKKDGVAVVAFFFQAFGDKKDESFAKISDNIKKIRTPGSTCAIDSGNLAWTNSFNIQRLFQMVGLIIRRLFALDGITRAE